MMEKDTVLTMVSLKQFSKDTSFTKKEENTVDKALVNKIKINDNDYHLSCKPFLRSISGEDRNETAESILSSYADSIAANDVLQVEDIGINEPIPTINSNPILFSKIKSDVRESQMTLINSETEEYKIAMVNSAPVEPEVAIMNSVTETKDSEVSTINLANKESEVISIGSESGEYELTIINSGSEESINLASGETKKENEHILSSDIFKTFSDVSEDLIQILKTEAMFQVNKEYGEGFYDFCLIASDDDYDDADDFKCDLMKQFNLKGCMLEDDNITLGRDLFHAYEFMMNRSAKVMFYLTENFNERRFCRRLQNGAVYKSLMSSVEAEKCVPIFPKGEVDIPLALSGVLGINLRRKKQFVRYISSTFSKEVRAFRILREKHLEQLKQAYLKELLCQKIKEHIQSTTYQKFSHTNDDTINKEKPQYSQSAPRSSFTDNNRNNNLDGLENVLHSIGVDREGVDRVMQSILDACSKERNVTVTNSKNVHVGNKIDVTVMVGASKIQESDSERSTSDDSEYSDSRESSSDNSECELKDL